MPTLYQQRSAFGKELLRELRPLTKGSAWKCSRTALVSQRDDWYQDLLVAVHRNSAVTRATLGIKPMGIDPILWDILGLPENRNESLSFRTWGAFTCGSLPLFESNVEAEGDSPREVADALLALANEASAKIAQAIQGERFSTLVARHPFQQARGAFSSTLVPALIDEGDLQGAREIAVACLSGALPSTSNFVSEGKSFYARAIEWLDARSPV